MSPPRRDPFDLAGHHCPDETATVVNGRWICQCPSTGMTLSELGAFAARLIADAERDGVAIDDGNVVDLVADHCAEPLHRIRSALWVAGFSKRFPRAVLGEHPPGWPGRAVK